LDIAVDIRIGSPTFGKWVSVLLSGENHLLLYIPKGFAHGFAVRSETADFLYKCSDYYDASDDRGVLWNDPEIGIDWQTPSPILSDKDKRYLPLAQIARDELPRYQPRVCDCLLLARTARLDGTFSAYLLLWAWFWRLMS